MSLNNLKPILIENKKQILNIINLANQHRRGAMT
jgi:hypothetical protein